MTVHQLITLLEQTRSNPNSKVFVRSYVTTLCHKYLVSSDCANATHLTKMGAKICDVEKISAKSWIRWKNFSNDGLVLVSESQLKEKNKCVLRSVF